MDLWVLLTAIILVLAPLAGLGLRTWIKSAVERAVQHHYDERLEELKGELRRGEELLKADLRARELEITSLREGALAARTSRRGLLDKRRIQAVERLWAAIGELATFKVMSSMIAIMKVEAVAKEAARNPDLRRMLEAFVTPDQDKRLAVSIFSERPFLSPLSWALFAAYQVVLTAAYARMKAASLGLADADRMLDDQAIRKVLIAALPRREAFIREQDMGAFHYLLEELEQKLLEELRRMLDGEEDDETAVRRAAEISRLAAEAAVANAGAGGAPTAA